MNKSNSYLFIIDRIENGGAEKQMLKVASLMSKHSEVYITSLLAPTTHGLKIIESSGLTYCSLPSHSSRLLNFPLFRLLAIRKLISELSITSCVSFLEWSNILAIMANINSSVSVVCNVRNYLSTQYGSRSKLHLLIAKVFIGAIYPRAGKIICNSHAIKQDLEANFNVNRNMIDVIYNSYNLGDIRASVLPTLTEDDFSLKPLSKGARRFIAIGRLSEQKNFKELILSFNYYQKKGKLNDVLYIVGNGPLEESLKELSKDMSVEFIPHVDNPFKLMAFCDCFILNSLYEGFPNVLAEACILGLDVLSVDCLSGPREILTIGEITNYEDELPIVSHFINGVLFAKDTPDKQGINHTLVLALDYYRTKEFDMVRSRRAMDMTAFCEKLGNKEWFTRL
jgi:glycosyltransferase involved in cell wall biosynthesis